MAVCPPLEIMDQHLLEELGSTSTSVQLATMMIEGFIIIFIVAGTFAAGVESFSIPPSHLSRETTSSRAFYSTAEASFWGVPRSEEEIVDFVSDAVFNNEYEALKSDDAPPQDRWVEMISAEPPVRHSNFVSLVID